jgi:FkbM family methyltransferase
MSNGTALIDALRRLSHHRLAVDHMISLGAGSGANSVIIRDRFYPGASLIMVEAQADHEPALIEACGRSGGDSRYVICAASAEDGEVRFQNSSLTGGAVVRGDSGDTISVPARFVDSLAREYGLSGQCFLKFDTHGVELDILAGARDTIARTSLIMMEVYNFKLNFVDHRNLTFDEMCGHLRGKGFRCVDLCDPLFRPNDHAFWQAQMFFIRADHPLFRSNSYSAPPPFAS